MASRNPAFDRLLSYSQKNDNVSITSLLATGCPATHANGVGQTALHIAALWGNSQALSALLAEIPLGSSDLNLQNRISGATPLHCATQSNKEITGRVECVKLLVAHGASVTVKDSYGDEANKYTDNGEMRNLLGGQSLELHELVKTGDASAITAYVQSSESPLATLSTTDSDGNTPLCLAIIANLEEVALLLLGMVPPDPNDAPVGTLSPSLFLVNLSNNDNSTPLILAARCGMTSVVSKLLEMNADPLKQDFASDDDGMAVMMGGPPSPHFTALHYAAHNKDLELVEMLLKNGGDSQTNGSLVDDELAMKPWHHLFDRGVQLTTDELTMNMLQIFADNDGLNVDGENSLWGKGTSLLQEASKKNNVNLARFLIKCGADVNKPGRQGLTSIMFAARGGKVEILKLLLETGNVDLSLLDGRGNTALETARKADKQDCVLLLEKEP